MRTESLRTDKAEAHKATAQLEKEWERMISKNEAEEQFVCLAAEVVGKFNASSDSHLFKYEKKPSSSAHFRRCIM